GVEERSRGASGSTADRRRRTTAARQGGFAPQGLHRRCAGDRDAEGRDPQPSVEAGALAPERDRTRMAEDEDAPRTADPNLADAARSAGASAEVTACKATGVTTLRR